MTRHYLACDLGAESGRLMLGTLTDGHLSLEELHRFPNGPRAADGSLHWDIPRLRDELKVALKKVADRKLPIAGISTDSWGVDYVLFDEAGSMMPPVFHYRDPRCPRGVENVYAKVSWPEIFAETGLQFMQFNTIFQLAAEAPERLARARMALGIGDAFNHWLSGIPRWEESLASTTQLYDPRTHGWSVRLLERLGWPVSLLPTVVPSGTRLGPIRPELAAETGVGPIEVIASCSHDTGAAVAAVPAQPGRWAYLSSGTWSLMGVELTAPIVTEACRELNFTNEIGFGGSIRLLKNIIGLWLVQECRRAWAGEGQDFDYAVLTQMAEAAEPFVSLLNPADGRFLSPGDMPQKIAAYCREHGQPVPTHPGAMVRCILESLALLYRQTLNSLVKLAGYPIDTLHIVGGGSKNALLNQMTANALRIPVVTGPVEATAAGNILVQAIALGDLDSLSAARKVVRQSFECTTYAPRDQQVWDAANERFQRLLGL